MKYIVTTRHRAVLSVEGQIYNILCEDDGDIALSINGEYVCDVDNLPTQEELMEFIDQYAALEEMADADFQFIRGQV